MNKTKLYGAALVVITAVILWDLVDYFFFNLLFPRELLDRYIFALPMVMVVIIVLFDHENKKQKSAEMTEDT